ncbi:MAG TPA: DeoR/GlpR family DNA-binding transcription regulator [Candidatus Blautia gallistercoris]|uniref:DeoR/GlpR family DNA-binding transcription regulator n=1 Tax=Candidatus Blautia gallistercoris TaxID=2838490 RepID=A0A9D1WIY0_9FIRM|nr:DeoR/GlpR family DNA-binding transcription regulator [Candidatus Blautia gallistercoris]
MKKEERQRIILNYLAQNRSVTVSQLAERIPASLATLRKDLNELNAQNKLIRSYGGAILPSRTPQEQFAATLPRPEKIVNLELKERIAEEAARLISDHDTIFIGCGSTFSVFARYLRKFQNLRIVTTNLNVACELAATTNSVYFIGGELMEIDGIYYTGGPKIPYELEKVFVNKAFIGVSGVDIKAGLTIYDLTQLNLYSSIYKIARSLILVCDKTKFGCQSAHRIGPIQGYIQTIVTNKELDPDYKNAIEEMGIRILTA